MSVGSSVLSENSTDSRLKSLKVIDPAEANQSQMSQFKLNLPSKEVKSLQLPHLIKGGSNLLESGIKGYQAIKPFILQPLKEELRSQRVS